MGFLSIFGSRTLIQRARELHAEESKLLNCPLNKRTAGRKSLLIKRINSLIADISHKVDLIEEQEKIIADCKRMQNDCMQLLKQQDMEYRRCIRRGPNCQWGAIQGRRAENKGFIAEKKMEELEKKFGTKKELLATIYSLHKLGNECNKLLTKPN